MPSNWITLRGISALVCAVLLVQGCNDNTTTQQSTNSQQSATVSVSGGEVEGVTQGQVISFKGIPYAAAPVDELRWRPPQAVKAWDGVLKADDYGNDCMQLPFPSDAAPLGKTPAEDCLYINVWKPKDATKDTPVLLWFYGGGYVNGGASPAVYDGSHFAENGVIFVSFNYRLGRFGFFAHPALTAEAESNNENLGNYAFMDQIAALQWVNNNIAAFGGDPDNVTIVGESAGGGSVHTMMQAPQVKGLFNRAVIMSGGGRSLMGERKLSESVNGQPSAQDIGVNFAESKGIDSEGAQALAELRALSAEEIVDGLNLMAMFSPKSTDKPTYVGGPIADGKIIQGSTEKMISDKQVAQVDVMVGATSMDIGFNMFPNKQALFASFGEYGDTAKKVYDANGDLPFELVGYLVGQDRTMQEPARFVAKGMTAMGQDAYYYRFSYVAESIREGKGAAHATDIPFFFNTVDAKYGDALTPQDKAASDTIHQYVVNFVKTGNPNGEGLAQWSAFDPQQSNMMDFSMDGSAKHGTDPIKARLDVVEKAASLSF